MTNQDDMFRVVEHSSEDAERVSYSDYSYWKSVFSNFAKKKSAVVMVFVFLFLVIFSFVALWIGKYSVDNLSVKNALSFIAPFDSEYGSEYWFGTDHQGRDYWCQVWYAAQTSVKLSLLVALGECVLGVIMGCLWGYVRWLDRPLTELYNIISNVPMIIYLTLIALLLGRNFYYIAGAMIATGWLGMGRNVRNLVLMYRDREYNLASRCLGTPVRRVLMKNIFPYLISIILLRLALSIPGTIAMESTLSYLGVGLDPNEPSLGILLSNSRNYFVAYPYLLILPAVIVSTITITFYLVGNAFSDAADPRNHV